MDFKCIATNSNGQLVAAINLSKLDFKFTTNNKFLPAKINYKSIQTGF